MVLLEKNKVKLSLQCATDIAIPGEQLRGVLHVQVYETVHFTALRVRLRGREESYVRRRTNNHNNYNNNMMQNNNSTYLDYRFFTHVEEVVTLFGSAKGAKSRAEAQLEPGSYSYPFSLIVPPAAPPSFCEERYEYGCSVYYNLKAILDIPMGFDGSTVFFLRVPQMAPVGQLQAERQAVKVLPVSEAAMAKCGCECSGFCCTDADSYIRTEAMLAPGLLVTAPSMALPEATLLPPEPPSGKPFRPDDDGRWSQPITLASNPNCGVVRLRITNCTKDKDISRCHFVLSVRYNFLQRGAEETHELKRCEWSFPNGPLHPGVSAVVEIPLEVTSSTLLPTFSTRYFTCVTRMRVTFPEHKADGTLHLDNAILLASGIDTTNRCPPTPQVHNVTFSGSD